MIAMLFPLLKNALVFFSAPESCIEPLDENTNATFCLTGKRVFRLLKLTDLWQRFRSRNACFEITFLAHETPAVGLYLFAHEQAVAGYILADAKAF